MLSDLIVLISLKKKSAEEEQIVVVGAAAGKKTRRKGKATGLQIVDQNQRSTRSKAVKGKKEKVVVVEEEDENEEEEELQKPQVENSVMKGKLDEAIMAAASANSRYRTRRAVKLAAESNIALVKNNIPAESTNRRPKRTARA
jgi:riboflavin biosynthesis pyrimidine reductase